MNTLLCYTEKQKNEIRARVNLSEERIEGDVEAILEWYKKQQHLPRIELDPRMVECILISRKGSVEQTKQKIDMMYSLRNVVPQMALTRDVLHPKITSSLKGCCYTILPKLNKDLTRINIISYSDPDFFNVNDVLNYVYAVIEYRLIHDSFAGDHFIFDFQNLSLGHITKYTPAQIKHIELYIRKAYGIRIFGLHMINGSNLLNKILSLFKLGLTEKIAGRIYVHNNMDDLYKVIDRDILPVEYGGKEKSVAELIELWKKELSSEETRNYLKSQEGLKSNESLRIGGKLDDEILGIAGSFRKLDVD